jgi:uncharacterized HAD superfamily protein
MKISFDLDGVLYPWHQIVWDSFFRKDYPDYIQFWKNGWLHISTEKWNELLPDPSLYQHPARADVVRMVHDIGMTKFVYYISSRPASLAKTTTRWLVINGFPCPGDVYLAEDKAEVCKKLKIDLHVEDRLDVMHDLADNGIRVLGIKQPWNEDGIDDFPHVDHILKVEREIARIETTMKVHRRRNGNE